MSQRFQKGRTNNHLTWVMVDATDFATPESAVSAATTIKIYGKLATATGVNFLHSGVGSLPSGNDIQHVGASATGIYTVAFAAGDLSDASAAWYDQYIIALSATGCARQVLIIDGDKSESRIFALSDAVSNAYSAAVQGNSRALVIQSHASQIDSVLSSLNSEFLSRVPEEVAARSQLSDLHSDLRSYLVVLSDAISDLNSDMRSILLTTGVSLTSDTMSNIRSAIAAGPAATITVSDISAIAAAVWDEDYTIAGNNASSSFGSAFRVIVSNVSDIDSMLTTMSDVLSNAYSAATVNSSRLLLIQSSTSQIESVLSSLNSEFLSRVPAEVAARSQVSDLHSDLRSYLVALSGTISDIYSLASNINSVAASSADASDIASAVIVELGGDMSDIRSAISAGPAANASDIASVVWTNTPGAAAASRILRIISHASQIESVLSDLQSDFQSRVPKLVATNSQVSDLSSDLKSAIAAGGGGGATASDIASHLWTTNTTGAAVASRVLQIRNQVSDLQSDFQSRVPKLVATSSQLSDLHSDLRSHITVTSDVVSSIYSLLSDLHSDVGVVSGVLSDTYSALATIPASMLSAAVANPIHANVKEVNDVSLLGDGSGTPWGPE